MRVRGRVFVVVGLGIVVAVMTGLQATQGAAGWAERLGRQARSGKCTATGLAPVAFPQVSTGTPSGL
jgi:hypothetical protein